MENTISGTNFSFPNQKGLYKGKVRDVYEVGDLLFLIATDRISAFDHILPKPIPYKGQVLNQIAAYFLEATKDIVPNWLIATPDPNVSVGYRCEPYRVEMVVRGYLTGHSWRIYDKGGREICGVKLPDGMIQNQKFESPIITPTTKAMEGHDEDISREDIIKRGIVSESDYTILEEYAIKLYNKGAEMANERGLILVDTKYEFGNLNGKIVVIDEIHTPDSSRYFYLDSYDENQKNGLPQKQLSKEFVREWLMSNGFQGKENEVMPEMPSDWVNEISENYIKLFELITGKEFNKILNQNILDRIETNIRTFLS